MEIQAEQLERSFRTLKRRPGVIGALRDLTSRDYETIHAVRALTFAVPSGELVGFIGPNGAGKSTTIKMLVGLLEPDGGFLRVAGYEPFRAGSEYLRQLGVVFGQRNMLWWDLPVIDSFEMLRQIYGVDPHQHAERLERLGDITPIGPLFHRTVRTLSLGQRTLCNVAGSMLHAPRVLLLDEPTIGLDLMVKESLLGMVKKLSAVEGSTVLMSSHDLADIEFLCTRVMVIDRGSLIFDGPTSDLRTTYGSRKTVSFRVRDSVTPSAGSVAAQIGGSSGVQVEVGSDNAVQIGFDEDQIALSELLRRVLNTLSVVDLRVDEPDIAAIVRRLYAGT